MVQPLLIGAVLLAGTALVAGCSCGSGSLNGLDGGSVRDGTFDELADGASADDGAVADGAEPDASDPRHDAGEARFDGGADASIFPPYPMRCPDEEIPGFRPLDGGWFRACNCFDGVPLRPVPTQNDEGVRTIPFDCAWPEGTIYHRGSTSTPPTLIDALSCEPIYDAIQVPGFVTAPYEDVFASIGGQRPEGIPRERICVPTECVFDTPGEAARCAEECAPFDPDVTIWGGYTTVYRVDRTVCESVGDAAGNAGLR